MSSGKLRLVYPQDVPCYRVHRRDRAAAFRDVHDAVGHYRRRCPSAVVPEGVTPDRAEPLHIGPVDLVEWAESLDVVSPPVVQPVTVFRLGQPLVRDRLPSRALCLCEHGARREKVHQEG